MRSRIKLLLLSSAMLCAAVTLRLQALQAEELEDHGQKSFNVHPGGTINFDSEYGSVTVKTADTGTATIQLDRKVEASTAQEARKILDDLVIEASEDGDTVRYRARFKNGWGEWKSEADEERTHCHNDRCLAYARNLRQMSFTVTVPRQFNLDLTTEGGHMQIDDIEGRVHAETSGGHVSLGNITGPVNVRTAGGHIDLASAKGKVDLQTAGGHIHCGDVEGDLNAHTAGGAISLGKIKGKVEAKTAGGSIEIDAAEDAVQAQTSGGSIRVKITGQPNGDSDFETAGGAVTLYLPAEIRANIDARGSHYAGRIRSDFPITMETASDGEIKGSINGGGPAIVIRDRVGSIHILKGSD